MLNLFAFTGIVKEREEESNRLKKQRITEEAEQKRLASEYTKREEQRIQREIEEEELEEAQALLQEAKRRKGEKMKNNAIEGACSIYLCALYAIVMLSKFCKC